MSEKPILFSGPMVRAILDGTKTQTRRVVKNALPQKCPYKIGDILWVRETWATWNTFDNRKPSSFKHTAVEYRAGGTNLHCGQVEKITDRGKWRPSIFMPRWASRINLRVTDVSIEGIQDISEEDAIAEGIDIYDAYNKHDPWDIRIVIVFSTFRDLWNSINAKRGYSYESNPKVWAIKFEVEK
jgi:hypothetical protein